VLARAPNGLEEDAPSGAQLFWPVMRWRVPMSAEGPRGRRKEAPALLRSPAARGVQPEEMGREGEESCCMRRGGLAGLGGVRASL
jgi:hypothetical protein